MSRAEKKMQQDQPQISRRSSQRDPNFSEQALSRRTLLKGLSLFLGVPFLSSLEACTSKPHGLPDELNEHVTPIKSIQSAWQVPSAVIALGREVLAVSGDTFALIEEVLRELSIKIDLKNATSQEIAKVLRDLHLEATKRNSWVEVKGWRLSTVEAAAYALSSFDLS